MLESEKPFCLKERDNFWKIGDGSKQSNIYCEKCDKSEGVCKLALNSFGLNNREKPKIEPTFYCETCGKKLGSSYSIVNRYLWDKVNDPYGHNTVWQRIHICQSCAMEYIEEIPPEEKASRKRYIQLKALQSAMYRKKQAIAKAKKEGKKKIKVNIKNAIPLNIPSDIDDIVSIFYPWWMSVDLTLNLNKEFSLFLESVVLYEGHGMTFFKKMLNYVDMKVRSNSNERIKKKRIIRRLASIFVNKFLSNLDDLAFFEIKILFEIRVWLSGVKNSLKNKALSNFFKSSYNYGFQDFLESEYLRPAFVSFFEKNRLVFRRFCLKIPGCLSDKFFSKRLKIIIEQEREKEIRKQRDLSRSANRASVPIFVVLVSRKLPPRKNFFPVARRYC